MNDRLDRVLVNGISILEDLRIVLRDMAKSEQAAEEKVIPEVAAPHVRKLRKDIGFYSIAEQMELVGVSRSCLWKWAQEGIYPKQTKLGGNRSAGKVADINEWLDDPEKWREKVKGHTP